MNKNISFITSFLTFYLKGGIEVTDKSVQMSIPNTILKFIPLGSYRRNIPINQISSVENSFSLNFKMIILGAIMTFIGLGLLADSTVAGIIVLILGINAVLSSFETYLVLTLNSGKVEGAGFIIFEKSKALEAEEAINISILNRLDDTNTAQSADRIVEAINNK